MAKNPTQLEELQNLNIESEMMAFNGTKKAFRAPLSSLTNVLNAGNLKMPGSDISIADYYRYMSGKQILINADFEKPVNQRSQTTYPAAGNAYIIDCWNAQNAAVRLDSDGIVFEGGNGFNQSVEFPEKFLGKTITLSALVTENSAEGNFGPNTAVNAFNHSQWPAGYMSFDKNTAPGLWTITGKLPDSMPSGHTHLNFGMWFLKNERLKIRAMKLEFGDHQTLAHREGNKWVLNDPPPDYALELLKCQRYFWRYKFIGEWSKTAFVQAFTATRLEGQFIAPVQMRTMPTVRTNIEDGELVATKNANLDIPVNYSRVIACGDTYRNLWLTFEPLDSSKVVIGDTYFLRNQNNKNIYLDFDANL